jgi:hypothetical protein
MKPLDAKSSFVLERCLSYIVIALDNTAKDGLDIDAKEE